MGNKQGYAAAILRTLGLRSGSGAERYLWCEPDPGCQLLLTSYTDADLRSKAAEIIRSWKEEDPRALWERLRAEGPVKAPPIDPREVARWCFVAQASYRRGQPDSGYDDEVSRGRHHPAAVCGPALSTLPTLPATITPDARAVDPREVARWIRLVTANRLINVGPDFKNTGQGGSTHGGDSFCTSIPELLDALDRVPDPLPASITPDARTVDPREVARWCWVQKRTLHQDVFKPCRVGGLKHTGGEFNYKPDAPAPALSTLPTLPATILPDARDIDPPQLPPGSVVYIDPPYVNTTGYAHDLGRDAVCELAERWASAGAWVVISEAEPLSELSGWHEVEITGERIGQKRTFSKQQREYLTMSRPPVWTPSVQGALFMASK